MTGLPTILVELDDGSDTFPHDITAYVHMPTGISVDHGRQDEFSSVEASRLSLRLDNVDGRFTVGAPTYDIHVDQRIRITETVGATVSKRFTGYVQDWPMSWPSPTATMATVTVSAFDRFTRLARRKLRSLVENEILLDSPVAYYTLAEAEGSTSAGDTSGNGNPAATMTGTGTAVAFGATGPGVEGQTCATFAGGKWLLGPSTGPVGPSTTAEAFFKCAAPPASLGYLFTAPSAETAMNTSGQIVSLAGTSVDSYADGEWHHVMTTYNDTGPDLVTTYVDGVMIGTSGSPVAGEAYLQIGGREASPPMPFVGTLAHVAFYDEALSAARAAAHASAGLTGFAGESSDERIERLAAYAGLTAGDLDLEAGALDVPAQAISGRSDLDAMRDVEQAEGGVLYVNGDGQLALQNRTHRALTSTGAAALAITAADVDHDDLTLSTDKQYLQNTVTGTRTGGATQTVVSANSVAAYDEYPASIDLLVATDAEVLARINWQANAYDDVAPRLSSVTIDLLTCSDAIQEAVLALEIGDRLTVSGMPTQSPIATADLIIEGWSERVSSGAWSITFNTAPAELFHAWILGDSTYGVLGTTTRLHF